MVSSSVPNPPGSEMNPLDSFISISLRVKKYFIEMSFSSPAMNGFALLLERQADVDAEGVRAARAFESRRP